MVSVGILGVIMMLIWSTTSSNLRAKDRIEGRDEMFHAAEVALRKIADDASQAFLVSVPTAGAAAPAAGTAATGAPAPAATPPAVVGAPAVQAFPLKTFFIGEDRGDRDAIRFTSLSNLRLVRGSKQSDQCKVAYETVESPDDPHKFQIVRKEDFWLDDTTDVKDKGFPIIENVVKFDVEYYDDRKGEWGKQWNSEQMDWLGKLPQAVRVTIGFADPDDETKMIPLSTTFLVPLSAGPIDL